MENITIPIPEGLPAEQRKALVGWLTREAAAALPQREAFENDAAWQAETARRIKAGIEAGDAGRGLDSTQARRRLDARIGNVRRL